MPYKIDGQKSIIGANFVITCECDNCGKSKEYGDVEQEWLKGTAKAMGWKLGEDDDSCWCKSCQGKKKPEEEPNLKVAIFPNPTSRKVHNR